MLNEINDNSTVEEVGTSNNIGDDASAAKAPAEVNKKIKDYLNPGLFNEIKTVSIDELEPETYGLPAEQGGVRSTLLSEINFK